MAPFQVGKVVAAEGQKTVKAIFYSAFLNAMVASLNFASAAEPPMLDDITIMALGALDGRAVVKTSDGKMQVLKLGDTIPGTTAIVTQILNEMKAER